MATTGDRDSPEGTRDAPETTRRDAAEGRRDSTEGPRHSTEGTRDSREEMRATPRKARRDVGPGDWRAARGTRRRASFAAFGSFVTRRSTRVIRGR